MLLSNYITRLRITFFFALLTLISCSSQAPTSAVFTATPLPPATDIPPTDPFLPTETPTAVPTALPDLERPQYVIDLQFNYSAKAANVNETITYPNWSGETLNNLILAVEPNLWSGGFSLKSLSIDNQPVTNYIIENLSQRLEIPLPQPLQPNRTITLTMTYGLILPQMQAYSNPEEVRPQI